MADPKTPPADPAPAATPPSLKKDGDSQLIVSMAIVVVLGCVALALIVSAGLAKDWTFAAGAIGAIIGALATALNAPTGIANALKATQPPSEG